MTSSAWIGVLADGTLDTSQVEGVDDDLVIKPFHQKAVVASVREFTVNAMNHHHGIQPVERFGAGTDPDGDGIADELTEGDITALTVFQVTLPTPGRVTPPNPEAATAAERGRHLFSKIGCATCHIPELPLNDPVFTEPGPYNPLGNLQVSDVSSPLNIDLTREGPMPKLRRTEDGTVLVPAFTDLKRHRMGEALNNETIVQAGVPTDQWLTRKLWGLASDPPFLHHGRATLISEAIAMHGGEAEEARDNFQGLSPEDQKALIESLKTLQVLPEGAENLLLNK